MHSAVLSSPLQLVFFPLLYYLRTWLRTMGLLDVVLSIRDRADKFLNEKNVVTDFLGKLEEKTGIRKKIIAAGTWGLFSCCGCCCCYLLWSLIIMKTLLMILLLFYLYLVHVYFPVACQWNSEEDSVNPPVNMKWTAAVCKHEPGNVLEVFWVNICAAVDFKVLFKSMFYINDGSNVCRWCVSPMLQLLSFL